MSSDTKSKIEESQADRELVTCPTCEGTGEVHSHNPRCWTCGGSGKISRPHLDSINREHRMITMCKKYPLHNSLNQASAMCHEANKKWWIDPETGKKKQRNKGELLMLIVSEISEAMEGERKNLMDDKLPHRKMAEVELADALIRIFDYAGAFGYDLHGAFVEKMDYNATREDHTHEARALPGGKKW